MSNGGYTFYTIGSPTARMVSVVAGTFDARESIAQQYAMISLVQHPEMPGTLGGQTVGSRERPTLSGARQLSS